MNFGLSLKKKAYPIACVIMLCSLIVFAFYTDVATGIVVWLGMCVIAGLIGFSIYIVGESLNIQQQILDKLNHISPEEEPDKNETAQQK